MLNLEQRLKRNDELRINYFKFMENFFKNGYAIAVDSSETEHFEKVRYQSHFCVNTSNKFWVVFNYSAKFKGVCVKTTFCLRSEHVE